MSLPDVELERADRLGQAANGRLAPDSGTPLSAGRGHPLRRSPGDSFKLSQLAAGSQTCRAIVFCGVHFMAETADVLSRDEVEVYLPDLAAGCSMADMADLESVEAAWQDLGR